MVSKCLLSRIAAISPLCSSLLKQTIPRPVNLTSAVAELSLTGMMVSSFFSRSKLSEECALFALNVTPLNERLRTMPRLTCLLAVELSSPGAFAQGFSLPVEIDCYLPRIAGRDGGHTGFRKSAFIRGDEFRFFDGNRSIDIGNAER